MLKLKFLHVDVLIKLFRYSLDGAAHDWCSSLPVSSVSSLKSFHTAFHSFYEDKFSVDFLYRECCHEFDFLYKGSYNHKRSSYVEENFTVEEIVHDNNDVECLPTIVYDYYGFEDIFALDTNHEDEFFFSQMEIKISEGNPQQLSDLQINEIGSNHETRNMHRQSKLQLEQHE
jgi:hypothetical protein